MQTISLKRQNLFYGCLIIILGLLLFSLAGMMTPAAAAADPVVLEITGDGITTPMTFTRAQLESMEQYQHVYSAINTWPNQELVCGEGCQIERPV